MCKYRVDQHSTVLNLLSVSIDNFLLREFMSVKVSQNLNSMQKMSTQWNS